MPPLHGSTRFGAAWYRALPAPMVTDPVAFLGALEGEARGFWGRGDRWVAWGGALARIEVPFGHESSRFERVRLEAGRILRDLSGDTASVRGGASPRFFGGFAFIDTGSRDGVWTGFPSAAFVLPRLVLEGRGREVQLLGAGGEETTGLVERLEDARPPGPPPSSPIEGAGVPSASGVPPTDAENRRHWGQAVRTILDSVKAGRVDKAVVARVLDVRYPESVDPLVSLRVLRSENASAHVFLLEPRPGRIFLGAAPEILAELRGGRFRATAVAGSMARSENGAEDAALARRLLESEKDRSEHGLTADEMIEVLAPRLLGMEVENEPRVLKLARIQHLETVIRGEPVSGEDILSLVAALHPTPAVCGRPRDEALSLIRVAEPFDRGWYAGPVGWFDASGEGDFVPALRSAVGGAQEWRLFAGAGIVAGSEPEAEWEETALKFEPAFQALSAGAAGPRAGVRRP